MNRTTTTRRTERDFAKCRHCDKGAVRRAAIARSAGLICFTREENLDFSEIQYSQSMRWCATGGVCAEPDDLKPTSTVPLSGLGDLIGIF